MKKVLVLGSTGSIGVNTLNIIRQFRDRFAVAALTVNTRIDLLQPQIQEFKPPVVVVKNEKLADELRKRLTIKCEVLAGIDGLISAAANLDYDILLGAMVGFAGLAPTLEAIKRGKRIALANKETLVVGGELVTELCKKHNSEIIPVDSEHSAIYQCLVGENAHSVQKIILTASGGPFLHLRKDELNNVTVKDALNHPTWKMGNKVTIDSASMMNKGLEVIEAHWLFSLPKEKIEVIIHPQSIIHSMVEFIDGSIKAQMGLPDMKLPIQYALGYPERLKSNFQKTCLPEINTLNFIEPDMEKFECLKLAYEALDSGGTAPCVLNAANEVAVERFLNGEIKLSYIPFLINKALEKIENHKSPDIETIFECDKLARELTAQL
ncbi:MAG: 1-deoxy-D-xylulose-5-phosphate reductoisomerase [Ignavibacteria bacterium RIFOXYB2_FULL_35_12]|nr:MAG: 1-deoxy-D-xylulose-5-phosphate reductoisomerase [Ignavibacteria bacterium GWA2_36_19]OGU54262.1 MAG: 1-deoxy-D-xylulose-5-phosphate reductoisomerase [Ignavibacteria bacterium GWC2_35_8]OGU60800.1 MAG: 1-deoxy-D-xylulose-5-phosphate reductoisomerase [Ignavibacteria bacterium GWF2_35_20]OGU80971.1 MAG: 1-deoxy-D-xylulose-5-phosphate reductoisomerase [Ignavibacteria bacterium RBG_16_35_7]OGU83105.1 MAG: 1-deoxy-D-xylulose-5-phosphate reductoisomerase [Ignavibacteria bacterium RIFOXYA2_FULL